MKEICVLSVSGVMQGKQYLGARGVLSRCHFFHKRLVFPRGLHSTIGPCSYYIHLPPKLYNFSIGQRY